MSSLRFSAARAAHAGNARAAGDFEQAAQFRRRAFLLAAYKAEYLAARRLETLRLAGREKYDTRGRQRRGQKNEHRRPALGPEDDDCQVGREE